MRSDTSTLEHSERHFKPLVLAVFGTSLALGFIALVTTFARIPHALWLACAACWTLLQASDALYLVRHRTTTIGMLPVSVFALNPALIAALNVPGLFAPVRLACAALLALCVAALLVFCIWFWRLHSVYAQAARPAADAVIIVLGGAVRKGKPRPTLARRLDEAARLWHEQTARTIVVSGGPLAHEEGTEADAMARYLIEHRVDPQRILLERKARNTAENVAYSLELIKREGLAGQTCVLTSDYHLYRAVAEGRRLGCELLPLPAYTPWPGRLQQWCREVLTILAQRFA